MEEIRHITEKEKPAFMSIGNYSFGQWQYEPEEDDLAWLDTEEVLALFVDGRMAARLRNRSFTQIIRGVPKPMGGLSSVASFPEYRRRGYIRRLMAAVFTDMEAKKQPVSALFPFRQSFYRRFGYVNTNSYYRLKVPTTALQHLLPLPTAEDGWTLTRIPAEEAQLQLQPFERQMAAQHHGYVILPDDLHKEIWNFLRKDQHLLFVEREGVLQGALRYSLKGFMDKGELTVHTMFWRDLETRDIILGFIGSHVDNAQNCWLPIPPGANERYWLGDIAPPLVAETSFMPLMVRIIDPSAAITELPAAREGELIIRYTDPHLPQRDGLYRIAAEDGRLHAHPHSGAPAAQLTVDALSALVFGAAPPEELRHRGWLTGEESAIQLLAGWFPVRPVYNPNFF